MFVTMAEVAEYVTARLAATGPRPTAGTVVAASTLSPPININPYFELDLGDWTQFDAASLTRSSAQAHQGAWSARLVPDGVATTPRVQTAAAYPIDPTHRYEVAAWIRPDTANKTVAVYIAWADAGDNHITSTIANVTPVAGTWLLGRAIFTPPAGAALARPGVRILSTPAAGDAVYVDEVTLSDADAPRPPLQVVMDGSALAVPVKRVRGVPVGPGARVMLQKVGADPRTAEWVSVGPLSDPATGVGNRLAVGADVPAELRFRGVDVAILWYIVNLDTGVELGYFFDGISSTIRSSLGIPQRLRLSGSVLYPVAGDPASATDVDVRIGQEFNLSGLTTFRDNPVVFAGSVDSVTISAGTDLVVAVESAVTLNRPHLRTARSAAQNGLHNTWVLVGWDADTYDVGAMHDPVTNNSRIVFPRDGEYSVSGQVTIDNFNTGTAAAVAGVNDRRVMLRLNSAGNSVGGSLLLEVNVPANTTAGGSSTAVPFNIDAAFVAGDYVEAFWMHRQGGGITMRLVTGGAFTTLQAKQVL